MVLYIFKTCYNTLALVIRIDLENHRPNHFPHHESTNTSKAFEDQLQRVLPDNLAAAADDDGEEQPTLQVTAAAGVDDEHEHRSMEEAEAQTTRHDGVDAVTPWKGSQKYD